MATENRAGDLRRYLRMGFCIQASSSLNGVDVEGDDVTVKASPCGQNSRSKIEQIEFVGNEPPSHNLSFAIELILHNHGADSGARNWSPIVEFVDGHRAFFSETVLRYYPAGPHGLGENITRSTAPIARYGKQRGWLMFSVQCAALFDPRNLHGGGLDEIKQVTIFVSDYAGGGLLGERTSSIKWRYHRRERHPR
jgi:hypothetical protein